MAKTWIFQDPKQVQKHGADKAAHYVGWIDPEGKRKCKSCGSGALGKKTAKHLADKIQAELLEGTYKRSGDKKTWQEFREAYERRILDGMEPSTRTVTLEALGQFERLIKPVYMRSIKTQTVDDFTAKRRTDPGRRKGDVISPATLSKELRHLKSALRIAKEWGYLAEVPKCRMIRELGKLPTYVTGEHFAAIYAACDKAKQPADQPFPAADWWRGLVVTAYMKGWRIGDLLSLRRADVDLENGTAISRAENNKGKRDDRVQLHPVVVEHMKRLAGFDPCIFPWEFNIRRLYAEFARIQEAAGIRLPCSGEHKHTRFCYVYGFHDFRRAFATMNADKLSADALQSLMRHKSYTTTQRYINLARQMDAAVAALHVPDVLKPAVRG
jgi:integrase